MTIIVIIGLGLAALMIAFPQSICHLLNKTFNKHHPPCCSCRRLPCENKGLTDAKCPCWDRELARK